MQKINEILTREPLAFITAIIAIIGASIALLPLFGVPLTADQIGGIMAVFAPVGSLVVLIYTRPKVTPMAAPRTADGNPAQIIDA